uniref:Uncharacterized protein n=1 Tax=Meloidogyne hapla TaxID=6305 RepID=A0A1I8BZX1_MELHA
MSSYFSFKKLFLIIFISISLNIFPLGNAGSSFYTNQRQSSGSGGGNSYGEYGQYYGNNGKNGNELELRTDEWNGGRRRSNTRILSEQQQHLSSYNKKILDSEMKEATFELEDYCTERCQLPCYPSFFVQGRSNLVQIQFKCSKLKPIERKLHEKLVASISGASIFEFFVAGIICFCKNPQIIHRNRGNNEENELNKQIPVLTHSINGTVTTSTGVSPEHEHLVEKIPHIDEGIHPAPLNNNGGFNHQHNQQKHYNKPEHHYVKTNLFKGNGEHSIV